MLVPGYAESPALAFPVTNAPTLGSKTIAHIDIASRFARSETRVASFDQPPISHKSHSIAFVGQVGPKPVVEDVILDRLNCRGQRYNGFGFTAVLKGRCVDCHGRQMVEMRVCDEEGM